MPRRRHASVMRNARGRFVSPRYRPPKRDRTGKFVEKRGGYRSRTAMVDGLVVPGWVVGLLVGALTVAFIMRPPSVVRQLPPPGTA